MGRNIISRSLSQDVDVTRPSNATISSDEAEGGRERAGNIETVAARRPAMQPASSLPLAGEDAQVETVRNAQGVENADSPRPVTDLSSQRAQVPVGAVLE